MESLELVLTFDDMKIIDSWRTVGWCENLATNADVAKYLIALYLSLNEDNKCSVARCVLCNNPLTLRCNFCQPPEKSASPHQPPLEQISPLPMASSAQQTGASKDTSLQEDQSLLTASYPQQISHPLASFIQNSPPHSSSSQEVLLSAVKDNFDSEENDQKSFVITDMEHDHTLDSSKLTRSKANHLHLQNRKISDKSSARQMKRISVSKKEEGSNPFILTQDKHLPKDRKKAAILSQINGTCKEKRFELVAEEKTQSQIWKRKKRNPARDSQNIRIKGMCGKTRCQVPVRSGENGVSRNSSILGENNLMLKSRENINKNLDHEELTKFKQYMPKTKGRPRSKLVSAKYLGALKKPNGRSMVYSSFECAHCQNVFSRKSDFNKHVSVHYNSESHICVKCGDSFGSSMELKQHKQSTHSKLNKPLQFECKQCPTRFKTEGKLHLHNKLHEENKLHSCKTCGFVASSRLALKNHRHVHRKAARVQCEYCGVTKRVNNMRRHILVHRGEKPYKCTQCTAAFRTPFDLKDHVKRRHSEMKPFSCEICGKGFICIDNLRHHLRVHRGQKPFKCSHCSSSFSRKDYLTKHIRIHTGEKPYKCDLCKEAFAYPNSLKLHKKQCRSSNGTGLTASLAHNKECFPE